MRSASAPVSFASYARTEAGSHVQSPDRAPTPAGTGVGRRHELKPAGELERVARADDAHRPVLQRLAQRLQRAAAELRQLVEEQDAVVGERHLTRARRVAAADQPRGGDRVMGCAERPPPGDRVLDRAPAGARHLRGLDRLGRAERRHDRGQPPRGHRLASARWAADQQIECAACGGHLERPAQPRLAAQVGEVAQPSRERRSAPARGAAAGRGSPSVPIACRLPSSRSIGITPTPAISAASRAHAAGTASARIPALRAASAIAIAPGTGADRRRRGRARRRARRPRAPRRRAARSPPGPRRRSPGRTRDPPCAGRRARGSR